MNSLHASDPLPAERRSGPLTRLAAGVIAFPLLAGVTLLSVGIALRAPVSLALARWVFARRGRRIPLLQGLGIACLGCTAGVMLGLGALFASLPPGTMQQAMAAAETQPQPEQPEWVNRLSGNRGPQTEQVDRVMQSRPATIYFMIAGFAFSSLLLGSLIGSLAWGGTLLLRTAVTGRRPSEPLGRLVAGEADPSASLAIGA